MCCIPYEQGIAFWGILKWLVYMTLFGFSTEIFMTELFLVSIGQHITMFVGNYFISKI